MSPDSNSFDIDFVQEALNEAMREERISATAVENLKIWLKEPRYSDYADQVVEHIRQAQWDELEAAFWTVIPFGTAGRRGRMYPIGSNAINDATIGETAQGLAAYLKSLLPDKALRCAIAYDTRHRSRQFAELCAEVMVANGIGVAFLDGHRSTPALASAVRYKSCDCGIMVSASHNPPTDNAVKIFWSDGAQIRPPHDQGVLQAATEVDFVRRTSFDKSTDEHHIEMCQDSVDEFYQNEVLKLGFAEHRSPTLRVLFSPLHGVAATSVLPVLLAAGFNTELYPPHAEPSGDFPNVPNGIANPEDPAVFVDMIQAAKEADWDLILASDPDADRIGCAARVSTDGPWRTLNGNQIGVLIFEYLLAEMKSKGQLSSGHFVVKTLVTTEMLRRIADAFGVRCFGEVLTGFKWIGQVIDEHGPSRFVLGVEEAHGYLAGTHIRDKDGAVAALLLAEAAARANSLGHTLHSWLDECHRRYGCHTERTITQQHPGADGMARMTAAMDRLRSQPPETLGEARVERVQDYLLQQDVHLIEDGTGGEIRREILPFSGPKGNVLILRTSNVGNYVAVRPSGTEPKIKFYFFTYTAPEELGDLDETKSLQLQRIDDMAANLFAHL